MNTTLAWFRALSPFDLIFFVSIALLGIYCAVAIPAIRTGDGSEYVAMFLSWSHDFLPYADKELTNLYVGHVESGQIVGLFDMSFRYTETGPFNYLVKDDQTDYNHFWFVPLLASLFSHIGLDIYQSFIALHVFLTIALILITKIVNRKTFPAEWVALLVAATPLLWFVNKFQVEYVTVICNFFAFSFAVQRRFSFAACAFAISATQNVHFSFPAVLCLCMVLADRRISREELVASIAAIVLLMLHPLYYYFRHGFLTPQLAGAGTDFVVSDMWERALALMFSPEIGFFWLIPIVALSAILLLDRRREIPSFVWWILGVYVLLSLLAGSATSNVNSGGTRYVARYGLWFIAPLGMLVPLVSPIGIVRHIFLKRAYFRGTSMLGLLILALGTTVVAFTPDKKEIYTKTSIYGDMLLDIGPPLYEPFYEIYSERVSGYGDASARFSAVVGPSCEYVGIGLPKYATRPIYLPSGCFYDVERLKVLIEREREGDTPFYFAFSELELSNLAATVSEALTTAEVRRHGPYLNPSLGEGWDVPRAGFAWSIADSVQLLLPSGGGRDRKIQLIVHGYHESRQLVVSDQSHNVLGEFTIEPKRAVLCIDLKGATTKELLLDISKTTIPHDIHPHSHDLRPLGIGLRGWKIGDDCQSVDSYF